MKKVPKIIQDVGFNFHWDNKKVWALVVPVKEMGIPELEWHFDVPFWNKPKGGYYDLTPNNVLANQNLYGLVLERIMKVDLSHLIDIMFWKGRWLILDGLHRLVKQKLLGEKAVKVRKIPAKFINRIKK